MIMKQKLLLLVLSLSMYSIGANAQNYKNDGQPYDFYCIVAYSGASQNFSAILIFDKFDKKNLLVDQNGEKIKFETCADLFTYMSKRGWKLIPSPHSVSMSGRIGTEWLFVKTVISDEEAKEGLYVESDFK